ncbi:related to DNA-directed RNA polymerases I and III subunit RPAC2 [Saccharomycodes ludwigii]|uniref:Related to DNA-directed RNA polymerases I and III subunit RPAC2 n=1 Tax=Saccharomycodes ludwigii TaxID=36035 RepID=A0A376B3R4_9ASCO|nr:hypothetical protein SCDLUD_002897 [Saccharomycodes ludwigii]KAH3901405.1 hypothetical protein SCDLUD_002897 [Saccharomycodes ludwigii]SSD59124.1 related to DNA-directed RNA polymerases I and III subunit RPAC2 [Saccharomycodes ludwigii]
MESTSIDKKKESVDQPLETTNNNNAIEDVDMLDNHEQEEEEEEEAEEEFDGNKIRLLREATADDGTCASFQIAEEDHTLGNSLRYIIMKNPQVEFCGYSIPHPSENFLHLRIQTYGEITAVEALHKGLQDLMDLCDVVEDKFTSKIRDM